jgi:hypothetical protein
MPSNLISEDFNTSRCSNQCETSVSVKSDVNSPLKENVLNEASHLILLVNDVQRLFTSPTRQAVSDELPPAYQSILSQAHHI